MGGNQFRRLREVKRREQPREFADVLGFAVDVDVLEIQVVEIDHADFQ